jgi:hypothetical protein
MANINKNFHIDRQKRLNVSKIYMYSGEKKTIKMQEVAQKTLRVILYQAVDISPGYCSAI